MVLPATLFPESKLVLMHPNFKNRLANLRCNNPEPEIAYHLQEILKKLSDFAERLNCIDERLEEVKRFIEREGLKIAKFSPKQYYDNNFNRADDLFFYFKEQDVNGYWIAGVSLFFPHLFLEKSLNDELRCCSLRGSLEMADDMRFCEIYDITYR